MNKQGLIELGPSPSLEDEQTRWDEAGRTEIVQIFLWHGNDTICGIQFQYLENDKLVLSELFGSNSGATKFHFIRLNYPAEQIIAVRGKMVWGNRITSLKVVTNQKTCGPYGQPDKDHYFEKFEYEVGMGQFGGFYGIEDLERLNYVGIYLKPVMTLDELNLIEQPVKAEKVEKEC